MIKSCILSCFNIFKINHEPLKMFNVSKSICQNVNFAIMTAMISARYRNRPKSIRKIDLNIHLTIYIRFLRF